MNCLIQFLPSPRIPASSAAATAMRASRRARRTGMARIAPAARRTAGIAAARSVMHQLGNGHRFGEGVAAMLANVGLHFLATLRIIGISNRLSISLFQGISTAFLACAELGELLPVFFHHNHMAVATAIWRKLQSPSRHLSDMIRGQIKVAVSPHRSSALGAATFFGMILFLLENQVINPAHPRCHPHGDLVA